MNMHNHTLHNLLRGALAHRYVQNTGWAMVNRVVALPVGLVVGALVARHLGPANYGAISYAEGLLGLLALLQLLGLNTILPRDLIRNREQSAEILGSVFILRMSGAALRFIIILVIAWLFEPDSTVFWILVILGVGSFLDVFTVIDFFFEANVQVRKTALANLWSLGVTTVYRILLLALKADVLFFAGAKVIAKLVKTLCSCGMFLRTETAPRQWHCKTSTAIRFLGMSWPLILSGVFVTIYMHIDKVMIRHMLDTEQLGQYAVTIQISTLFYFIQAALGTSLFPALVSAREKSSRLYEARFTRLFALLFYLGVAISMIIFLTGRHLTIFIFGPDYEGAVSALRIHVWSLIAVFLGTAAGRWIVIEDKQIYALPRVASGAIANVLLNLWMIPMMGISGAAVATVVSYYISGVFFFFCLPQLRECGKLQMRGVLLPIGLVRSFYASRRQGSK